MRLKLKESRTGEDGAILGLVVDEEGRDYLFEPLNLTVSAKEKLYLELLHELRQVLATPVNWPAEVKVFSYLGVEKCGNETGLLLAYDQELWEHWPEKGAAPVDPVAVATAARSLLALVPTAVELGPAWTAFYPGDLVSLGPAGWGLLDPRVQQLLAPYRKEGERREFFTAPETRSGFSRTEVSYLYTLGLTLYQLATGEFPFPLQNRRETVTAMLREEPLDPRYFRSELGEGLAQLILKLLERKAQLRPEVQACARELAQVEAAGRIIAEPEEAARFRAAARPAQEKAARKRRWYWRWQRWRWPLAITVALVMLVVFLGRGGYEEKITPESTPREVVMVFYDALAKLDAVQLEEPLANGAGKDFINLVSVLHVTSKMREVYEGFNGPMLELKDLEVSEAAGSTPEAPAFTAVYHLRMVLGEEYVDQDRRDQLVMVKKKKEWRIGELRTEILAEERTPLSPAGQSRSPLLTD